MEVVGHIKFTITKKSSVEVVSEMPIQAGVLNPYGVVNAGAILWFADVTAAVLIVERPKGEEEVQGFPLAININANLVNNSKAGKFIAKSTYVKKGRTVNIVRTIVTDQDGKLISEVTTNHLSSK